jgi:hypothetical protein
MQAKVTFVNGDTINYDDVKRVTYDIKGDLIIDLSDGAWRVIQGGKKTIVEIIAE